MPSKNPRVLRGWAILHYLNKNDDNPEVCKLFYIQTYLRTNWAAAKELVEYSLDKGWIEEFIEPNRHYKITDAGRSHLVVLREVLSHWHDKDIQSFSKRAERM